MNRSPPVNIHSHLWGAVLFVYLLAIFHSTHILPHPSTTWKDSAVFMAFLSSVVFCLSGSAIYHMSGCHSEEVRIPRGVVHYNSYLVFQVSSRCQSLDYSGIVILTVGSFYTTLFYGFYCEPLLQLLYILSITLVGLGE